MPNKTQSSDKIEKQQLNIPLYEKLKSIPEIVGIRLNEEPKYHVLKKEGPVEIRHYEKQLIATVTLRGLDFDSFREQAFEKLAAYIFGGNISSENMAMTSPVYMQKPRNMEWTMSFFMGSEYDLTNVPKPTNLEVKLEEIPAHDAVALMYSGNNPLTTIKHNEKVLRAWLHEHDEYKSIGKMKIAQYDAPFVIPFLKRNEILALISSLRH